MKILFTICGRAGSKGIRNKNIREFAGKRLPYYSISAIDLYLKRYGSRIESDISVSSDSLELLELAQRNPIRQVEIIERSADLVGDTVGKIAVVRDCLIKMQQRRNCVYDIVVDLDITSPLRTVLDMEKLVAWHVESGADVTTSVTAARRNPYFNQVKRVGHGYGKVIMSDYTARQQAPEIFDMNASLYAYSPAFLESGKGLFDGYCECIEMYDTGILDLDHENDFELMEVIARYLFEKNLNYREVYSNIC